MIDSGDLPSKRATFEGYRAQAVFERLAAWLRKHGVTDRKPIHMLRKEFGSQVCAEHGIYAASRALRHANITITESNYLDSPRQATSGLGSLFKATQDEKIVPLEQERSEHTPRKSA